MQPGLGGPARHPVRPGDALGLFSTTATGLGGLTLAELVKPGVIYLKSDKVRLPWPVKGP